MVQDWQWGKQDAEWNFSQGLLCFVVDLRGTRPLPLFSTPSFIWIPGKGCHELTGLRLNSGTWTQDTCSQNCHSILEYFACRNGDGAVEFSIPAVLIIWFIWHIYTVVWWRAIGRLWPWSPLPWHLASIVVHTNNNPGEESNRNSYTWRGQQFHIGFLLCLAVFRGYIFWQGPNIR